MAAMLVRSAVVLALVAACAERDVTGQGSLAPGGSGGEGGTVGGGSGGGSGGEAGTGGAAGNGGATGNLDGVRACADLASAYTRIRVTRDDPDAPHCLALTLYDGGGDYLSGIAVPEGWSIERAELYPTRCGDAVPGTAELAIEGEGEVVFDSMDEAYGVPARMSAQVELTFEAGATARLDADRIEVSRPDC